MDTLVDRSCADAPSSRRDPSSRLVRGAVRARLGAALALVCAACRPAVAHDGGTITVTWSAWYQAVALVGTAAFALLASWLLCTAGRRIYGGIVAILAVTGVLLSFVVMTSRITVTADEVYDMSGFPWARTKRGFRTADVAHVLAFERVQHTYRSTKREHVWRVTYRDGREEELIVGDLWFAAHDTLAARLAEAGVVLER